jgi:pimeloyl-ACP methyl ester carboxylesterase
MSATPVEIVTGDGVILRGELSAGDSAAPGGHWLVLVHDLGRDLDCWNPFPDLWSWGLSVLAFDLRGHGGSAGAVEPTAVPRDVSAATGFARSQAADFVSVVAVGRSAVGALAVPADDLAGAYVLVSPDPEGLGIEVANLRAPGAAKMIILGSLDERLEPAARALCRVSIGLCTIVSLPASEQGTALLDSKWGGHAFERVNRFVQEQSYLASDTMRRF